MQTIKISLLFVGRFYDDLEREIQFEKLVETIEWTHNLPVEGDTFIWDTIISKENLELIKSTLTENQWIDLEDFSHSSCVFHRRWSKKDGDMCMTLLVMHDENYEEIQNQKFKSN